MDRIKEIEERAEKSTGWLRQMAVSGAKVLNVMADSKTARNRAAGDAHSNYGHITPQQTQEWLAADLITDLLSQLSAVTAERDRLREAAVTLCDAADNAGHGGDNRVGDCAVCEAIRNVRALTAAAKVQP